MILYDISWQEFKSAIDISGSKVEHIELNDFYIVTSNSNNISYRCYVYKSNEDVLEEFETEYKESVVSDRYYVGVNSVSVESSNYVPNVGEVIKVYEAGGNAGKNTNTAVYVVWDYGGQDEEYIISTITGTEQKILNKSFTGDGAKALTIRLVNDQMQSSLMGGWWVGGLISGG